MEFSKWSFFSLPEGIEWYLWGGGLCTAVQWSCGNSHQIRWVKDLDSLMLVLRNQWMFLNVVPWTPDSRCFFARWVKETQIPHGTMREIFQCCLLRDSNRAWRFWMCSFFLPCLVARAETHPLKKLLVWCLRVSFCRSALFNECEQKLSADTNTWISIQKLEKILHPMKRRWPGMQRLWDLHQIWFIRAFSSHSFFQD